MRHCWFLVEVCKEADDRRVGKGCVKRGSQKKFNSKLVEHDDSYPFVILLSMHGHRLETQRLVCH